MASKALNIFLIGCAVVVVVGIIAVGVGGYLVKNWFSEKGKTISNIAGTKESDYGKKVEKLRTEYPFTPPSNGILTENQVTRFLAVRKAIFGVYKAHEPEFKKLEDNKEGGLSAFMQLGSLVEEVKLTQAKALEDQRMSPDEYTYLVTVVYTNWAAKLSKDVLDSKAMQESVDRASESIAELDKQLQDTNISEEQKKYLQQTRDAMATQLASQKQMLKEWENVKQSLPKENIELLSKYQKEIAQYFMGGLELLGL